MEWEVGGPLRVMYPQMFAVHHLGRPAYHVFLFDDSRACAGWVAGTRDDEAPSLRDPAPFQQAAAVSSMIRAGGG